MEPGVRSSAVSCCGAVTDRSAVVSAEAVAVPAKNESASKDKASPERAGRKAMSSGYRSGVSGLEGGAPTSDRSCYDGSAVRDITAVVRRGPATYTPRHFPPASVTSQGCVANVDWFTVSPGASEPNGSRLPLK